MRTINMFEIGEDVMIKCKIVDARIEGGNIKYKIKDEKTGKIFDWYYGDKDIIPLENKNEVNNNDNDE